jgi:transcription antitermination factor NusG
MYEEEEPVDRSARRWYVIHVKPRTEKKVALYLDRYHCFRHLPLRVVVRKVQRRKVRRELPLFPGYVFARMSFDDRSLMLRTNLIVRTIEILHPRETIHQLRQLRNGLRGSEEKDIRVMSKTFHEGDKVRVREGPMRGTEGYVKRDGGRTLLYLNVDILGSTVEVLVSPMEVEKI